MLNESSTSGKLLYKKWQYWRNLGLKDIDNIKDSDQPYYNLEFPDGENAWSLNKFELKSREGRKLDLRSISPLFD